MADVTNGGWFTDENGIRTYQSGNDQNRPNGMKIYYHKGRTVAAYCKKDVPMRYKYLYPNG